MILSGQKYSVGDHMVVSGLILHPGDSPGAGRLTSGDGDPVLGAVEGKEQ